MISNGVVVKTKPSSSTKLHLYASPAIGDWTGQTITVTGNVAATVTNTKFPGKCIVMDGTGDVIRTGTKANLDFLHILGTAGKWSIAFWYRSTSFLSRQTIYDTTTDYSQYHGIYISIETSRAVMFEIFRGVSGQLVFSVTTTGLLPNDSNWHYMVITYDQSLASDNGKIYVDGSRLTGSSNKTANAPSTTTASYVPTFGGDSSSTNAGIKGNIDDLIILSGVLLDGTRVPTRRSVV